MKIKKALLPLIGLTALSTPLILTSCQKNDVVEESKNLIEISVNSFNATTKFNLGEKFNADGLSVKAVYSDYSTKELSSDSYQIDSHNFKSNVAGTYTIYVIYTVGTSRQTKSYDVTVSSIAESMNPHVLGIEATISKTSYQVGEKFDSTGLKVMANYSDGTTKDVTLSTKIDESLLDFSKMGVTQLKLSYAEKYTKDGKEETKDCQTFILLTVSAILVDIEFKSGTVKLQQDTVGPDGTFNTLDTSDWVVEGSFFDAEYNTIKANIDPTKLEISNFDAGIAGEQTVKITYVLDGNKKTCDVKVTVEALPTPDYTFNASNFEYTSEYKYTSETAIDSIIFAGASCKVKIESSDKKYGNLSFNKRIQTDGAGKPDAKNYIKFVLPKDATVAIIGRASDAAKPVNAAGFYDVDKKAISDTYAYKTSISKYKYELKAGTYYFMDTDYAVQVYGIQIWYK